MAPKKKDGSEDTIEKNIFGCFDARLMYVILLFAILFLATLLFVGLVTVG